MQSGTRPQCRPKITSTCHIAPKIKPATKPPTTGRLYIALKAAPMSEHKTCATGPMTRYVSGTMMPSVSTGTINSFMTSGITFFHICSSFDATNTASMIGTTVEGYLLSGMSIGIPKNVA